MPYKRHDWTSMSCIIQGTLNGFRPPMLHINLKSTETHVAALLAVFGRRNQDIWPLCLDQVTHHQSQYNGNFLLGQNHFLCFRFSQGKDSCYHTAAVGVYTTRVSVICRVLSAATYTDTRLYRYTLSISPGPRTLTESIVQRKRLLSFDLLTAPETVV